MDMNSKLSNFFKRFGLHFIGLLVGAIGGYLYWHFIGCSSGACPITGNPYISTGYGAMLGVLLFSSFSRKNK